MLTYPFSGLARVVGILTGPGDGWITIKRLLNLTRGAKFFNNRSFEREFLSNPSIVMHLRVLSNSKTKPR